MSLKPVFNQVKKLSNTSSNLAKIELLKGYLRDPLFQKVAQYTLDSRRTYHVAKFPKYEPHEVESSTDDLFAFLDELNGKEGSTDADKNTLFLLASIDEETYELTRLICNGDLKCGCGVKTINKALMGSIFYIPYCRCSTETQLHRVAWPAYAQEKSDGTFTNMIIGVKGNITFLTRDGNKIRQLKKLKKRVLKRLPKKYYGTVFQGELLIRAGDDIYDRQTGNGIFSSCQHGSADQAESDKAIIHIWDAIPIDDFWNGLCTVGYKHRFDTAYNACAEVDHSCFTPVHTEIVHNEQEARDFYKKMRLLKKEGSITKDFRALWKDHTSPLQIKMKNVMDVETLITDIYYGESDGKYEKCLGGISCESGCGIIKVNAGGGFSDKQRGYFPVPADHPHAVKEKENDLGYTDPETQEYFPPKHINGKLAKEAMLRWRAEIGNVAELECESVSYSKSKDTYSLYLPRFTTIRDNKKADTFEGLKERGACDNIKVLK